MPITSATRGGGIKFSGEVKGIEEALSTLTRLSISMSPADRAAASGQAARAMTAAAQKVRDAVKLSAETKGISSKVQNRIFAAYDNGKANTADLFRALAGVNKRANLLTWTARANPKSARAKVPAGGKVAESLANMYERGTTKQAARAFFRPAYNSVRSSVLQQLKDNFLDIIKSFS